MLKEIYIQNLAVIREAVIPLGSNLNIFTGETGAGKSILINGINAVLGQRCTKDIVRTGCNKAVITALFTELSPEITAKLDELGISHENDEITLTREISADGGSVARINHRTASASLLKEIGGMLINIHGQHDNQILLDSSRHLQILDDFGADSTLLDEYRQTFRELQQTARKLGQLKKQEQEEKVSGIRGEVQDINFGSQIRSYILHPYNLVKAHRTGEETGNVSAVLDGELDPFINAYLKQRSNNG